MNINTKNYLRAVLHSLDSSANKYSDHHIIALTPGEVITATMRYGGMEWGYHVRRGTKHNHRQDSYFGTLTEVMSYFSLGNRTNDKRLIVSSYTTPALVLHNRYGYVLHLGRSSANVLHTLLTTFEDGAHSLEGVNVLVGRDSDVIVSFGRTEHDPWYCDDPNLVNFLEEFLDATVPSLLD